MFVSKKTRLVAIFVLTGLLLSMTPAKATESTDVSTYQNKLDRLQKSILKIQEHLKNTRGRRGHILTQLKELESNIGLNSRALQKTEKQIKLLDGQVNDLRKELARLATEVKNQQLALADQVRAAYAQGLQHSMKMLLNQQNPAEMGRLQVYFDYLNRAREEEITRFMAAIEARQKSRISLMKP